MNPPKMPVRDNFFHAATIAMVAGFVAQGFHAGTRFTAVLSVTCVAAAYFAIKFLNKHVSVMSRFGASPVRLSAIVAITLAALLAGALLRQQEIDQRSVDVGELADTFQWKIWWCHHNEKCIASTVSSLSSQVPESSTSSGEQAFRDQAVGEIARMSPEVMDLLGKLYGVNRELFLGTGEVLPYETAASFSFSDARVPEYLVPNYPDNKEGVVAWRFHPVPAQLDMPLSEVVRSGTPLKPNGLDELSTRREKIERHLALADPAPAVVRFVPMPPGAKYSGCLGLPKRRYVFASHLGVLMANNLSIGEAAILSGYDLRKSRADQDIYLFVFIPSHPEEIIRPTWTNVTSRLASYVNEQPYCK